MKCILAAILTILPIAWGHAQTVVFADNFNRPDSSTVGNNWVETAGNGDASIVSNTLSIAGNAIAGSTGLTYVTQAMSNFSSPWSPTLDSNSGLVTWAFNMRSSRDSLTGFDSGDYGIAFILAGSSADMSTGNGYAVLWGQSSGIDPVRLVSYSNGLIADANLTNMIVANTAPFTDMGTNYLSMQVTYNPLDDTWELLLRDDGTSSFANPSIGTLTSQGTLINSTYTGDAMTVIGAAWNHGVSTGTALFDNVSITVVPEPTTTAMLIGGLVALLYARRNHLSALR